MAKAAKQTVYILTNKFSLPTDEGTAIVGVYANKKKAIAEMNKRAAEDKADYESDDDLEEVSEERGETYINITTDDADSFSYWAVETHTVSA